MDTNVRNVLQLNASKVKIGERMKLGTQRFVYAKNESSVEDSKNEDIML